MDLIWHGTAAVDAVCGQGRILFDPFVPLKGSNVKVDIDEYDGLSYIYVTHCHLDHIVDLPEISKRNPGVEFHRTQTSYETLVKKCIENSFSVIRLGTQRKP